MNIAKIEENVKSLLSDLVESRIDQEGFIYELLLAYGHRKQSVTRLRSGERNLASKDNAPRHDEIIWKRHLYFRRVDSNALHAEIDQMRKEKLVATNKIRFVIVTNFDQLLAVDTKTSDSLDINLDELPKQFDFFLPWAGMEKAVYQGENPADVKAAEKMAKLFDLIKGDNFDESNKDDTEALHNLNVFLTRLLFCFFAEDTEIFSDNQFSLAIQSHTKDDGSDLSDYLNRLFAVLNTAEGDRAELPDAPLPQYLANFPYVNGGLFADDIPSPVFSAKSRRMLIECGSELDWSDINPDIFGSMIQAVVHPDQRGGMGMHYTSVTNIMKVIEPLFLNDLHEELEKVESSATKLQKLQQRLGDIKIFDPACGSGNFLIIAYKELRKLEMEVLKRLQELELEKTGQISQPFSVIKLSQFYGIELDDFAHEVAILSLWLAEHQMNVEFKTEFGEVLPSLPLKKGGEIVCGNATRLDWGRVCYGDQNTFVLGNPPYLGGKKLSADQIQDMDAAGLGNRKQLDYIGCWFFKASDYIRETNSKFCFVTTSSVCQGEQVHLLWTKIFDNNQELFFAYDPFPWRNNARENAGVWCTIVGIQNSNFESKKYIYSSDIRRSVENISPYLVEGDNTIVEPESNVMSYLPSMCMGSNPVDGKHLILSKSEYDDATSSHPEAAKYLRRYMGGNDFLKGIFRYCVWVSEDNLKEAYSVPAIKERIDNCESYRKSAGRDAKKVADVPYRFCYRTHQDSPAIILPNTSASSRKYIPVGLTDKNTVINKEAFAIYGIEPFVFAILSSSMHRVWLSSVGGRLGAGFRYSVKLVYNTFPIIDLSSRQIETLTSHALKILSLREEYPDRSIFELYSTESMPNDLQLAHKELDRDIDSMYENKGFSSDSQRLEKLFTVYKDMKDVANA